MNIVRLLGNKKVLTTIFGIALCAVGIQFSLAPKYIEVSCDKRWAPEYHQALKKRIERLAIRTIGASRLRDTLIEDYPCIKDVTFTYKSTLDAHVILTGWRPLVVVRSSMLGNKEYVVCEKGQVLEKTYFTPEALQGMPTITIIGADFEAKRRTAEFVETASTLKSDLFDRYSITWDSKTNIILRDTENKVTVTADITSIHDPARYAYIERIHSTEKRYKRGIKADIRLKDSIVCAPVTRSNL